MSAAIVSLHRVQAVPRPQEFRPTDPATATRFEASTARLGSGLGLTKLGCNVTVVPAGKGGVSLSQPPRQRRVVPDPERAR